MKTFVAWTGLWLCSIYCLYAQQTLVVNEIMASNSHSVHDVSGEFEDWFEIYNASSSAINLAGYYLSDDAANPIPVLLIWPVITYQTTRLILKNSRFLQAPLLP